MNVSLAAGAFSVLTNMAKMDVPHGLVIGRNLIFGGILEKTIDTCSKCTSVSNRILLGGVNSLVVTGFTLGTNRLINYLTGAETMGLLEGLPEIFMGAISGSFS